MEKCGQLHAATINPGTGPWCQLNRKMGGPRSRLISQIWNSEDRASWYILIIKTNELHYFSNLFWYRILHVSDRFTVHHQESITVYTAKGIPVAVYTVLDSWWWTVNMSETCRVLYQNKFKKWCISLVFIMSIISQNM